jgi:hypothetical protein
VDLWYKADTVKASSGEIRTDDYSLLFNGSTNVKTKAVGMDMGMVLSEKENAAVKASIQKNIGKELKGDVAKYVPPEKLTDIVMKRLVDEDGRIHLKFNVSGTTSSPRAKLVYPELPGLESLIAGAAGDVKEIVKDAAKKEAEKAIHKEVDKLKEQFGKDLKF